MWNSLKVETWSQPAFEPKQWEIKIPWRHHPIKQRKAAKDIKSLEWNKIDVDDTIVALGQDDRYEKLYRYAARSIWDESRWDLGT
jgi:Zn-dependent M28 family amino/carboxypeptidase